MHEQFFTWLRKLEKRVRYTRNNMHDMSKGMLARELNICNSFLNNLQTYAMVEDIDIDTYYDRVSNLHDALVDIQDEIERVPWFKKLVSLVRRLVAVAFDFVGFSGVSKLLMPPDSEPPLLLR